MRLDLGRKVRLSIAAVAIASLSLAAAAQAPNNGQEFIKAVRDGDGAKANSLISGGKNPGLVDTRDLDGSTALTVAIEKRDPDWVGFLLNAGADPNLPGKDGQTPLVLAARAGLSEPVSWLLGLGAKVDLTNKSGETPLIAAVQARQPAVVRLLLRAGADPDKQDSVAGYSARDYAKRDSRANDILKLITDKKPTP